MKIIDFHVHLGKYSKAFRNSITAKFPEVSIPIRCPEWEKYAFTADRAGIHKAVIFGMPSPDQNIRDANECIVNAAKCRSDLFCPVALMGDDIAFYEAFSSLLYGCKDEFYLNIDRKSRDYSSVIDWLQQNDKFLIIHPENREKVAVIKDLVSNFPRLKIVLAHSGRKFIYSGKGVLDEVAREIMPYPNVFFETSTIRDSFVLAEMCRSFPKDRILYGSDYPFCMVGDKNFYQSDFAAYGDNLLSCEGLRYGNAASLLHRKIDVCKIDSSDAKLLRELFSGISAQDKSCLAFEQKKDIISRDLKTLHHYRVVKYNDVIVGYMRESGRPKGGIVLEEIYVRENYRGLGLAKILIDYAKQRFGYVQVKTLTKNHSMHALLRKCSFRMTSTGARITNFMYGKTE